ncbi:exported hypothetical protein [uncultured Eubacteriales bacterium]|uniref:Endo-1,4-beta-xylanase A n=1 Tax=uncultured Eubacteriales bacterium TaxID=172733 RepID=A0A212JZM0_9FIRM|nr:exported hypothetical protein [uncultured Eubacteriales bacterium]
MKNRTWTKRFLSGLLALIMVFSLLPSAVLAHESFNEETSAIMTTSDVPEKEASLTEEVPDEEVSAGITPLNALEEEPADGGETTAITVDFTAQAANAFLCAPQLGIEVTSDLAESYGYTDGVKDGVSALDVLVKATETIFGDDFRTETKDAYLEVDDGGIKTIFGVETMNCGFSVNGKQPHGDTLSEGYYAGYTVADAAIANNDLVEFYLYQDDWALDNCVEFTIDKAARITSYDLSAGYGKVFYLYGYSIGWYGCSDEQTLQAKRAPIGDAQLCYINAETGEKTDIDGAVTDDLGTVTLKINIPGEYLVSAYIPDAEIEDGAVPVIMPLLKVNVYAAPVFGSLELYENQAAYKNGDAPIPFTPAFESSKLTGYTVTVPDYTTSFFVAAKVPGASDIAGGGGFTIGSQEYMVMYSNSYGGWSNNAYTAAAFTKGYVDIYIRHNNNKTTNYQIHVDQFTTLKALAVDGVMTPGFDKATEAYHVYADSSKDGIDITATPYSSGYEITINGEKVTNGTAYKLKYKWDVNDTMEVSIKVSGTGKQDNTYTLLIEKEPLENKPFIVSQPKGAVYVIGGQTSATPLDVRASAEGVLSYQWYSNDTNSAEDASPIANATSASYTPAVDMTGTTYYFCRITNTAQTSGNVTDTDIVSITVYPDPTPVVTIMNTVPDLPSDGPYKDTKGYVYDVDASATPLEVKCRSAAEGGTWSGYWIRGNSNTSHSGSVLDAAWTITPETGIARANDTGNWYSYKAKYTFNGKTYTVDSDYIYVYVKAAAVPDNIISTQPKSAEYTQGSTAGSLAVALKSPIYGTVAYQWYENTADSTVSGAPIAGATNTSYSLGTLTQLGTKYYYCIITSTLQGMSSQLTSSVAAITVKEDDTPPIVIPFTGSGTEKEPYQLSAAADFASIASLVAQGYSFEGMYFAMQNDIALSKDWIGIGMLKAGATNAGNGTNILPFSGTLDGKNHTLSFAEGGKALLTYAREATVQNLNIYAPYIADYALLTNYVVDYGEDGNYNSGTGGSYAPGCPDTLDVINVTLKSGSIIRMGGFLGGYASGGNVCNFTNCMVEPNVKIGYNKTTGASSGSSGVGSFAGEVSGKFLNCVSYADVYGVNNVGGIGGVKGQSMGPYSYSNCEFYGTITGTGSCVGGIAAAGYNSISAPNTPCTSIQNCIVSADITGTDKVGGILGGENGIAQNWSNAYVRNNVFSGTLKATGEGGVSGGIIGYFRSLNKTNIIENNYYCADGIERSIGRADYVDTSCKSHETELCKNYFDTSVELPTEPASVSRKDHNRTDDPLGADSDKLGKKVTAAEMADGSLVGPLNNGEGSYKNWVQGEEGYPSHIDKPVVYELAISGNYKGEYYLGETLNLDGIVFTAKWSDGTITTPTIGGKDGVTISGFDSGRRAVQTLTATCGAAKAEFIVTVLKKPVAADTITVYFTLLGDEIHDSEKDGKVHTLKNSNLKTWIEKTSYTVDINATAADVFKKALKDAGLEFEGDDNNLYKTLYVSGVQVPGTSTMLSEFTNGPRSGWMYTLNAKHPNLGLAQQFLENGDKIVFHYTDDYTVEEGSDSWNSGSSSTAATTTLTPTATVSGGTASVSLDLADMKDAIASAKTSGGDIVIAPKVKGTVTAAQVTLARDALDAVAGQTDVSLMVQTQVGSVTLPNGVLSSIVSQTAGSTILISVEYIETTSLTAQQQVLVSGSAVFDISILSDGKKITGFDGKSITISLPYTLKAGESADGVAVWYLDDAGKLTSMACTYNKNTGLATFTTTHLSTYVVGYDAWTNSFADVRSGAWYYDAVKYAVQNGLFTGTTTTTFGPETDMSRAMLVTVLYRLEGKPAVTAGATFTDVENGQWYTDAVRWANATGIITGYDSGMFGTNDSVTREQLAAILYRYADYKGYDTTGADDLSAYSDASGVSPYARSAMEWAVDAGLITGITTGGLLPGDSASRAQVATILMRFVENVVK